MAGSCGWFPLSSEQIHAWVQRHAHELPHTLAELSLLPIPFRKVIAATVPPAVRASLWREHLESFLGPGTELTEAQGELVRDAIAEFPVIFGAERPEAERRMRALEDRMRVLVTREQAGRIFGTLGPPEPPGGLPLPADALPAPAV
jgi:hypothetical protein